MMALAQSERNRRIEAAALIAEAVSQGEDAAGEQEQQQDGAGNEQRYNRTEFAVVAEEARYAEPQGQRRT